MWFFFLGVAIRKLIRAKTSLSFPIVRVVVARKRLSREGVQRAPDFWVFPDIIPRHLPSVLR